MDGIDRNQKVRVDAKRLGEEGAELGSVMTTYAELDATGNHGKEEMPLDDNPEFRLPSGAAYAIWASINGGNTDGRVMTCSGIWYAYEWRLVAA